MVWDLDNTLWNGILVEEDKVKPLKLKGGIVEVIKELDKRGIVNSIISKNDYSLALEKLKYFGIEEYFVFPEISWEPKSIAMNKLINNFNINANTIAFIDDSKFEREEVASQHTTIRIYTETEYQDILDKDEFNPDISPESSMRRSFYKNQQVRKCATEDFQGNYYDFVKSCEINLRITNGKIENIERIHELLQRTNQMNFSGNRYTKPELEHILNSPKYETFQLKCDDKFGDYGTVGFCVFQTEHLQIIDLAFSCRVQSKRVEHAFIQWLIEKSGKRSQGSFLATYNKTEKNTQSGKVFSDLNFSVVSDSLYSFSLKAPLEKDNLINVIFDEY
jgi:FkbH-like protein